MIHRMFLLGLFLVLGGCAEPKNSPSGFSNDVSNSVEDPLTQSPSSPEDLLEEDAVSGAEMNENDFFKIDVMSLDTEQGEPSLSAYSAESLQTLDLTFTQNRNEIVFHPVLFLPKNRKLFFVFPPQFDGETIQLIQFRHRVLRGEEWLESDRPKSVWYDDVNPRWYIPSFQLDSPSDFYPSGVAQPNALQVLSLDLLLEGGKKVNYLIKFRMVGPVSQVQYEAPSLQLPADASEFGRQVSHEGAPVFQEQILNPGPYSLSLWMRIPTDSEVSSFILTNYVSSEQVWYDHLPLHVHEAMRPLGQKLIQDGLLEDPVKKWWVQGELRVRKVRVHFHSASMEKEVLQLGPETRPAEIRKWSWEGSEELKDQWQSILLEPGEVAVLEWIAQKNQDQSDYFLPQREEVERSHYEPGGLHYVVSLRWSSLGYQIEGEFSRDLILTYPFFSQEFVIKEVETSSDLDLKEGSFIRRLGEAKSSLLWKQGEQLPQALKHSCQGILR